MKSFFRRGAIRRHITSAHIIALVALFVALGGISWAAATAPKNSVATKSIKKNAVTTAKIKNNAVTGRKIKSNSILASDIKNDALTGSDINESTLGVVPQSSRSTNQVINSVSALSSASNIDEATARAAATEIPIASYGSVSVYGKCFTDPSDSSIQFEAYAKSSVGGSALGGNSSDEIYDNPSLGPATPEDVRQIQVDGVGVNNVDTDYANNVSVLGPDGKGLLFNLVSYGRAGNPTDPMAALPAGDSCLFQIDGVTIG